MTLVQATKADLSKFDADAIVVNLLQGVTKPGGATGAVDAATQGAIGKILSLGDFKGKAGEAQILRGLGGLKSPRVILVGLGPKKGFDADRVREVSAKAARVARDARLKTIGTVLHGAGVGGLDAAKAAQALAEGVLMGLFDYREYKSKKGKPSGDGKATADEEDIPTELETCTIVEHAAAKLGAIRKGIDRGRILAEATNRTRALIMRPSIDKPPVEIARLAKAEAEAAGIKVVVLGPDELKKQGLGLLAGVGSGAGAGREPRLVVLEYPGRRPKKTVSLVGKGITFDSGGINIKPSENMDRMKYDMAGSATVLGAIVAAAQLKVKPRVVALMALAENMPSGSAIRPGDVLTAFDGTRVEVGNTDAEGRLVLGDAIAYTAKHHEPDVIVDVATLTGAVRHALGEITTGVMGNHDALVRQLVRVGQGTGEALWQLPLNADYEKQIKSDIADIKNTGPGTGGTIAGASFLKHFVPKRAQWAHLDIAGTCWSDKGTGALKKEYIPKGATGVGVRLLAEYLAGLA